MLSLCLPWKVELGEQLGYLAEEVSKPCAVGISLE